MSRKKVADKHAEREAQKYENPIPSREFIMEMLAEQEGPMSYNRIAEALALEDEDALEALRRRLRAMERDGQLVRNRRDRYGLVSKMQLISGRVIGHPDGFGFLVPDDGTDDLFLSARQMRSLLHGDRAIARISGVDRKGRREGAIVEILERAHNEVVGRFLLEHGVGVVVPDNKRITQDILVPPEWRSGAIDNQIVVVEIVEQPSARTQPIGKIVEILGDHMAPGMEIDIAIRAHELPREWPKGVKDEIKHYNEQVEEADKEGRIDLRDTPLVTIDGEDARDFDDAVFCEPHGKGWRLLVAIADVSHYVKVGSALDAEAHKRGNSVYFPGQVIPMLPEVLSNGLCSLNPQVDRLCMVCEMFITAHGLVRKYRFFDAVMRSAARLTYTEMAKMVVDKDPELREQHSALIPHLDELHNLYGAFKVKREKRGTIDFETTETRIVFGRDRKIEQIVPVERNDAHKLIEEFMIAANVCAAKHLLDEEIPALYRVHKGPTEEKLTNLREFLKSVGLTLAGGNEPEPRHYAKLLASIEGRDDAHLVQTVLLRSLSQAVYTPDNEGHFGLAFDAYGHFTSPIRRYPDLLVHRAIRHRLLDKPVSQFEYGVPEMVALGEQCSMTERRADDATRDATDWLKCEFMQDRVGEEFDGIITSVTGFGLFVELKDIYVEGLIHITSLTKDYYLFDAVHHSLVGEHSHKTYCLGDKIRIRVVRVDLDRKRIDFDLAESADEAGPDDERAQKILKNIAKDKQKKGAGKKSDKKRRGRGARGKDKDKTRESKPDNKEGSGKKRRRRRSSKKKKS